MDIVRSDDLGVNSSIREPMRFDEFLETVKTLEAQGVRTDRPPIAG